MLDNTDQKILAVIQKNASLPLSEISKGWGFRRLNVGIELKKWKKWVLFLLERLFLIEML